MAWFRWAFWLLCFGVARVLSNPNCPIQDAEYPKPRQLSESPVWKAAMQNLSATFDAVDATAANYSCRCAFTSHTLAVCCCGHSRQASPIIALPLFLTTWWPRLGTDFLGQSRAVYPL